MITSFMRLDVPESPQSSISKGWGFENIYQTGPYIIKTLNYNDNCFSSGHLHTKKDETFIVLSGCFELIRKTENGEEYSTMLWPNDMIFIPSNSYHQINALMCGTILEVSTDCVDDETIIVRLGMTQLNS